MKDTVIHGGGTEAKTLFRRIARRTRRTGQRGPDRQRVELGRSCGLCGAEYPSYRVEALDHTCLGCERCLNIYREGIVQL